MKSIVFNQFLPKLIILFSIIFLLNQCGLYRKTDAEIQLMLGEFKNMEEGRRIKFGNLAGSGSGKFEFATSNEMWRATIDILDFIPLANAVMGGVIITDWYNESGTSNESIKIMVQFYLMKSEQMV